MKSGEEFYGTEFEESLGGGGGGVSDRLEETRESMGAIATDIRERVEQHPYRALGVALGAGYILGGGLFSSLTGRLLFTGIKLGLRLAALPMLRDQLLGLVGGLSADSEGQRQRRHQ